MNRLEDFIRPTQPELFAKLRRIFKSDDVVFSKGNYILVPGEAPIMLLAHLDTVHKDRVRSICKTENGNILMSPEGIGGDDRCGVYALVRAHCLAEKKPWLLFTCEEEVGGIGASTFCTHHKKGKLPKALGELKLLVEIDRKGEKDAVFYDCANDEFEEYITGKGFKTDWGSFSDISFVAPELGVAAVNLSSGYYNAHTLHEYINRYQLNAVVKKLIGIISDSTQKNFPKYEYVESNLNRWDDMRWGGYGNWGSVVGKSSKNYAGYTDPDELKDIPAEIVDEYAALLDFYSAVELEYYRKEMGDSVISQLYREEIGLYDPEEDDEEDDLVTGGGYKWRHS